MEAFDWLMGAAPLARNEAFHIFKGFRGTFHPEPPELRIRKKKREKKSDERMSERERKRERERGRERERERETDRHKERKKESRGTHALILSC